MRSKYDNEEYKSKISDVNSIKSDMIRIEKWLEENGYSAKAKSLGKIIGRLEDWQNR
jgi:hypothetical protein